MTRIDELLQNACGKEFTAAVARIEHRGQLIFERAYGVTRADSLARPVYADTRFDLASLTKLFVATLALQLVADAKLTLDEPLSSTIIPEWQGNAHREITVRMLLAHTSGMNSGADYREILGENVEDFALRTNLVAQPGERVIYSDLGFIALGVVLRRVSECSLGALVARRFSPTLQFRPPLEERLAIPATEDDGWRGRVQGFVHDEKAYLMGGMAGHAGLFGTAADAAALTEWFLGALRGRANSCLPEWLVREAVGEQAGDPVLRRGLGWALKTTDENSCGRFMDRSTFGHTGFVGTCVWADPRRDLQGVLLTNSVYFGRNDTRDLRAAFFEAMIPQFVSS
jgi:serine-type D-Ala-D-Ala carboxypeptidase